MRPRVTSPHLVRATRTGAQAPLQPLWSVQNNLRLAPTRPPARFMSAR